MNTPLELTILMPCLNEAKTLAICIEKAKAYLQRAGIQGEVVISDNGSTDGSQDLARAHGARVVDVPIRGYGAALIAGIEAAQGRYIIMGDSDDSYDFSALDQFITELRKGHDLVMGNRFRGGISKGAMPPLHRYLGNPVLSGIGRLFFRSPIRDFHCGLRGFNRDSIQSLKLRTTGMEFASEMVVKATLQGLKITEVPTTLQPDGRGRPPHLNSWRDGWRHLRFLMIHAPAWIFMYPGYALLLLGGSLASTLAFTPLTVGHFVLDVHSMLYASAACVLGFQMVLFAALSSSHIKRRGLMPRLPNGLQWVERITLEGALIVALCLFTVAIVLSLTSVLLWAQTGFEGLNPSTVMRFAIPASSLMVISVEIAIGAFMLETLRI